MKREVTLCVEMSDRDMRRIYKMAAERGVSVQALIERWAASAWESRRGKKMHRSMTAKETS